MKSILVVGNDLEFFKLVQDTLSDKYKLFQVRFGKDALHFLRRDLPDLILLDLDLPDMDGKDTLGLIKEHDSWKEIPLIVYDKDTTASIEAECIRIGAEDFVTDPIVPIVLESRISKSMELFELRKDLEQRVVDEQRRAEQATLSSIMSIANTIDAKDRYTSGHSVRVAKCSVEIARRMGWPQSELQNLHYVALLHDIGKIGIPDSVLNKPTSLTEEEIREIRKHPVTGGEILKDIGTIAHVREGALFHHERYDGTGYPFGLKGAEIPIYGRVISLADAYDAMTSNRVYHKNLSTEEVIEELRKNRGKQFDPQIVDVFIGMLENGFTLPKNEKPRIMDADIVGESSELLHKVLEEYAQDAKERSVTDFLTGLYNRDYAESRTIELIRNGHKGALFMMDVDNFKQVNDKLGHIFGDKTLQLLADDLRQNSGENDIACRLGGDEFVMFFPDLVDKEQLCEKAEALIGMFQRGFQKLDVSRQIDASISIGIALSPQHGLDFESLYRNADKALYYIKNNGKSAYHFFSKHKEAEYNRNTIMDLDSLRMLIEGDIGSNTGVMQVAYDRFKNVYDFISRCVERKEQVVQTVLLTLRPVKEDDVDDTRLSLAMDALETAISPTLRSVDVGTRYSDSQYIIILMDAHLDNVEVVMTRVQDKFYEIYQDGDMILTYDAQTMRPKNVIVEELEQKEKG